MDLEGILLSEMSQRKTNTLWYHLCVESKKQNKLGVLWRPSRLRLLHSHHCGSGCCYVAQVQSLAQEFPHNACMAKKKKKKKRKKKKRKRERERTWNKHCNYHFKINKYIKQTSEYNKKEIDQRFTDIKNKPVVSSGKRGERAWKGRGSRGTNYYVENKKAIRIYYTT